MNSCTPDLTIAQEKIGFSYVPSLNVKYTIKMDIDRANGHIDLLVYVTGDGFPNCEAFVEDPKGQRVFLGTHVRKGAAPVTLTLNLQYPMIACALRIPINNGGSFSGKVGDELARKAGKRSQIQYQSINDWNTRFINMNPNHRRCMFVEDFSLEGCFN